MPVLIAANDKGFALIGSMLFLIVLTIAGIAATNTTSIESSIAGNERLYNKNFYLAEGAAKEAAQQDLESTWVWEANKNDLPLDGGNFDIDGVYTETSTLGTTEGAVTKYGIVDNDIPQGIEGAGHSLKVEGTGTGGRMNFFDLYGESKEINTSVRIIMGYTKRL